MASSEYSILVGPGGGAWAWQLVDAEGRTVLRGATDTQQLAMEAAWRAAGLRPNPAAGRVRPRAADGAMKRMAPLGVALALVAGPASPAAVAEEPTRADVRCIIADAYMAETTDDPRFKALMLSAGIFHMGRINGRDPEARFKATLVEEFDRMDDAAFEAESRRCLSGVDDMSRMAWDMAVALAQIESATPVHAGRTGRADRPGQPARAP